LDTEKSILTKLKIGKVCYNKWNQ